jgi:hypothetical protein
MKRFLFILCVLVSTLSFAQESQRKFEQLGTTLPTPNSYRTPSGAPGNAYWQQQADYVIDVELNDETQQVTGKGTITYHNNSPEALTFLWLQLDQNKLANNSTTNTSSTGIVRDSIPSAFVARAMGIKTDDYKGGISVKQIKDSQNKNLAFAINNTMMRIDLPTALKPGEKFVFSLEWTYYEADRQRYDERGGYEYFPADGNYVYTIAQWYPRMCVFNDFDGWQTKQYLGQGEFALVFGNYNVKITVPADHIVAATGWLQNPKTVLNKTQQERFDLAQKTFDKQILIVTEEEARKKEKERTKKKSTWEFTAENVRDFAFASSRKFIWDAQSVKVGEKSVLAQSLYPKEGNPLWEKESTKAIKNALEVYSERTFNYPYHTKRFILLAEVFSLRSARAVRQPARGREPRGIRASSCELAGFKSDVTKYPPRAYMGHDPSIHVR